MRPNVIATVSWFCVWCCEQVEYDVRTVDNDGKPTSGDLRHPVSCSKFSELAPKDFFDQSAAIALARRTN